MESFAFQKYFYRIITKNLGMLPFASTQFSFVPRAYCSIYSSTTKFHSVYLNNIRLSLFRLVELLESQVPAGSVFTTTPQSLSRIFLSVIIIKQHNILSVRQALLNNNNNFVYDMQIICMQIFLVQLWLGHYYIESVYVGIHLDVKVGNKGK